MPRDCRPARLGDDDYEYEENDNDVSFRVIRLIVTFEEGENDEKPSGSEAKDKLPLERTKLAKVFIMYNIHKLSNVSISMNYRLIIVWRSTSSHVY